MSQTTTPDSRSFPLRRQCPFAPPPEYDRLRAEEPVCKVQLLTGGTAWLVTRYEGRPDRAEQPGVQGRRHPPRLPPPLPRGSSRFAAPAVHPDGPAAAQLLPAHAHPGLHRQTHQDDAARHPGRRRPAARRPARPDPAGRPRRGVRAPAAVDGHLPDARCALRRPRLLPGPLPGASSTSRPSPQETVRGQRRARGLPDEL